MRSLPFRCQNTYLLCCMGLRLFKLLLLLYCKLLLFMQFSLLFGLNGIGLIIAALIFSRLTRRFSAESLLRTGLTLAVLCAAGYNLRWLLRAMVRLGLSAAFMRSLFRWLLAALSHPPAAKDYYGSSDLAFSGAA